MHQEQDGANAVSDTSGNNGARRRRVVIADDHPTIRHMLQKILARFEDVETDQASSFDSLKGLLENTSADLVLLDLDMPGVEGFSCLSYLRRQYPDLQVAIVSGNVQTGVMRTALARGAVGYIPKTLEVRELAAALQAVLAGRTWAPSAALADTPTAGNETSSGLEKLTPQQKRILLLIAQGRLNKQIAYELAVTEATIKGHVTTILRRLGVRGRTEAALLAQRLLEIS